MCSATWPSHVPSRSRLSPPGRPVPHERCGTPGTMPSRRSVPSSLVRVLLELAEVDDELDRGLVRPVVRSAVDPLLDDPKGPARAGALRRRARRHSLASSRARETNGPPAGALGSAVIGPLGRDAANELAGPVRRRLDMRQLAVGGVDRPEGGPHLASPQVESVARRQAVQDDPADHDRPMPLRLVGIGLELGRVEDGDRSLADDLQHPARRHDRRCPRRGRCRGAKATGRRARSADRSGCAARSAGR